MKRKNNNGQGEFPFDCEHVYQGGKCVKCGAPEPIKSDDICRRKHRGNKFSIEANPTDSQKDRDRRRIVLHIFAVGGRMYEEIGDELDMCYSSASARMSELKGYNNREKVLEEIGRRMTRQGKSAGVFDLTPEWKERLKQAAK